MLQNENKCSVLLANANPLLFSVLIVCELFTYRLSTI